LIFEKMKNFDRNSGPMQNFNFRFRLDSKFRHRSFNFVILILKTKLNQPKMCDITLMRFCKKQFR
jgi:hypothetical protein